MRNPSLPRALFLCNREGKYDAERFYFVAAGCPVDRDHHSLRARLSLMPTRMPRVVGARCATRIGDLNRTNPWKIRISCKTPPRGGKSNHHRRYAVLDRSSDEFRFQLRRMLGKLGMLRIVRQTSGNGAGCSPTVTRTIGSLATMSAIGTRTRGFPS